ncbi:MAG: radical SAM protein [Planctomycetaceae bacterium]|nr:radical SAM protein [Planctomycetaceae bacterium]
MSVAGRLKRLVASALGRKTPPAVEASADAPRVAPPFPHYICMELTNACNLRCIQCIYQGGKGDHYRGQIGYMDVDLARRVLDQLQPTRCGVMLNGDGEALLHPKFQVIARHAVSLGLSSVYFNTNGTLLSREFTDEFVTYFKGAVSISLDGFKESHDRIRRGSSYDKVVANIDYLLARIGETGAPITLSAAYCNYDQPKGERLEFAKYWTQRLGSVSVCEVYDQDYRIISDQINKPQKPDRVRCGVPWETFIVRWQGPVVPCSNCFPLGDAGGIVLGDSRTQTLLDIWNGPVLADLRRRTEAWDLEGTICQPCERWNMYVTLDPREEEGMMVTRTGVFSTYKRKDPAPDAPGGH